MAIAAPLLVEVSEGVATLTLNRPEALNALNRALKAALLDALRRVARDPEVRVVVVTGAGRRSGSGRTSAEGRAGELPSGRQTGTNPLTSAFGRWENRA